MMSGSAIRFTGLLFLLSSSAVAVLSAEQPQQLLPCPGDSLLDQHHDDVTQPEQQCRCVECPARPICPAGSRLERLHQGRGIPGYCCDDYGCVPDSSATDADCVSVICPQGEPHVHCPPDSILDQSSDSDGVRQTQKCCGLSDRCSCKPPSQCPVPSCPNGQKVILVRKGDNSPGTCCDTYGCVVDKHGPSRRNVSAEERTSCGYDGIQYRDGDIWSDGNCTECQCKSGLAFCKHTLCARLTCDFPVTKKGECCAVCEGCLAPDGVSRADSEEWRESDCVQCRCQNGQIHCRVEECSPCEGSYTVAGQCCPVCNNSVLDSVVLQPSHCVPLGKCKRLCKHGYTKHSDGCFRCECQVENCSLSCEFGYETDPVTGEGRCECMRNNLDVTQNITSSSDCQNVTACNSSSCWLTERQSDGCTVCECRTCPIFHIDDCTEECTLGYQFDGNNCLTCACIQPPATSSTVNPLKRSSTSTSLATLRPTLVSPPPSCEQSEESLIPWLEGCHECMCYEKRKMCDVILTTANASAQYGDANCVPQKQGDLQLVLPGFCEATAAAAEAQLSCTECVCTSGVMYCTELRCPVLQCEGRLVQKRNQCCPSCEFSSLPPIVVVPTSSLITPPPPSRRKVRCQVHNEIYESGATWWASPCRSCRCTDGAVRCNNVQCPVLDCEIVTVQKGRCCPSCFNTTAVSDQCTYGDITRAVGEIWEENDCLVCTCVDGAVICEKTSDCDEDEDTGPESGSSNRYTGRTLFIILAVTTSIGLSVLAVFLLIKKFRHHSSEPRGHHFSPIAMSEESSESHQDSRSPLSKSRPQSCFSLP